MKLILVLTHLALFITFNAQTISKPGLFTANTNQTNNSSIQANLKDINTTKKNSIQQDSGNNVNLKNIDQNMNKEISKKATKAELKETYNQFLAMENSPDDKAHMDEMMEKLAGITPGSEDSMIDRKNITQDPMTTPKTETKKDRELDVTNNPLPETYNNSVYNSSKQEPKANVESKTNPGMVSPIFNQPMPIQQQSFNPQPNPQLNITNNSSFSSPFNRNLGMGSFNPPDIEAGDPLMGSVGNEHIAGPTPDFSDMKNSFDNSMGETPASLDDNYGSNDHLNEGMHTAETQAMIDSMDQMNKQKMDEMDHKLALDDLANNATPGGQPGSLKHHRKKQSIASLLKDYPPELVQQFMPELKRKVMRKVHEMNERKRRNRQLRKIRNKIKRERRREKRRKLRLRKKHHHHHHNPRHHHHHHHHNRPHHYMNYQKSHRAIHFRPMTVKKHDKRRKQSAIKILKKFVHKHSRLRHWARNLQDLPEMEINDRNDIPQRNLEGSNPIDKVEIDNSPQNLSQNQSQTNLEPSNLNKSTPILDTENQTAITSIKNETSQETSDKLQEASIINNDLSETRVDNKSSQPQTLPSQENSKNQTEAQKIDDSDFLSDMINITNKLSNKIDDEGGMEQFIKDNVNASESDNESTSQKNENLSSIVEDNIISKSPKLDDEIETQSPVVEQSNLNQSIVVEDEIVNQSPSNLQEASLNKSNVGLAEGSAIQSPTTFQDVSANKSNSFEGSVSNRSQSINQLEKSQDVTNNNSFANLSQTQDEEDLNLDESQSNLVNSQIQSLPNSVNQLNPLEASPDLQNQGSTNLNAVSQNLETSNPNLDSQKNTTQESLSQPNLTSLEDRTSEKLQDTDEDHLEAISNPTNNIDLVEESSDPVENLQNNLNQLNQIDKALDSQNNEATPLNQSETQENQIENLMGNMGAKTLEESSSQHIQDFESGFQDDKEITKDAESVILQNPVDIHQDSNLQTQSQSNNIPTNVNYQAIQTDETSQQVDLEEHSIVPLTDQIKDQDEQTVITDESGQPLDENQKKELLEELEEELGGENKVKGKGKNNTTVKVDVNHLKQDQKINMFHYMPPQIIFVNPYANSNGQQMAIQQPMVMNPQQIQTNGNQQPIFIMPNNQMQNNTTQQPNLVNQSEYPQIQNPNNQMTNNTTQQPTQNNVPVKNSQPGPIINIHNNNHSHGSTHSSYEVGEDGQLHQIDSPQNQTSNTGQTINSGNTMNPSQPDSNWGQVVYNPNINHHGMNIPQGNQNNIKHKILSRGPATNAQLASSSLANRNRKPVISPTMNDNNTLHQIQKDSGLPVTKPSNITLPEPQTQNNLDLNPDQNESEKEYNIDVDPLLVNKSEGQTLEDDSPLNLENTPDFENNPNLVKPSTPLGNDRKEYLTVPYETDNEMKLPETKPNLQYQKTTKEFHHYLSPGETPDYLDLQTNPKYGHKQMMNTIWEMTRGRPANNTVEKNKDNGVTEEWVDDRDFLSNQKGNLKNEGNQDILSELEDNSEPGKSLNLNLSLTNSDLANMPDGYSKDFSTDAANVHFTIDKSSLKNFALPTNNQLNQKNCAKNKIKIAHKNRRLANSRILKSKRLNPERTMRARQQKEDISWEKAMNSFDTSEERIIDDDLQKYNPSNSKFNRYAPSNLAAKFDTLSADPRKSSQMLLGGLGDEDKSLREFIREETNSLQKSADEDQMAAMRFEENMKHHSGDVFRQRLV